MRSDLPLIFALSGPEARCGGQLADTLSAEPRGPAPTSASYFTAAAMVYG